MTYSKNCEIRWSDLDPNFHVRHSVYYDFGAFCRMAYLNESGLTALIMVQQHIGPIIFREEAVFKKEIKFGDVVTINLQLEKCSVDFSRWTMIHEIWKAPDTLAAVLTIDGAWLDTHLRKLTSPGELFKAAFEKLPKTNSFSTS